MVWLKLPMVAVAPKLAAVAEAPTVTVKLTCVTDDTDTACAALTVTAAEGCTPVNDGAMVTLPEKFGAGVIVTVYVALVESISVGTVCVTANGGVTLTVIGELAL